MPNDRAIATRRWVEQTSDLGVDAELGELFRAVQHETPLSDVELARVHRRLRRSSERRGRPVFRLVPVLLAFLIGGVGAAFAERLRPGLFDAAPTISPLVKTARRHDPERVSAPTAREAGVVPEASSESEPTAELAAAPASSASVARNRDVALESELLQTALQLLRRDHDGAGALRVLDKHSARFPAGVLALEAGVARVDALLLLGRRSDALEQLARLPLDRVGRKTELRLLRAELYAEHQCQRASSDFDAVLDAAPPANLAERALYGRAVCRMKLGALAAARADVARYLGRFPDGRFAAQARSLDLQIQSSPPRPESPASRP